MYCFLFQWICHFYSHDTNIIHVSFNRVNNLVDMVNSVLLVSSADTPLQTVWTQIRTDRVLVLIWIQTVWHSDGILERIFRKSWFWKKPVDDKKKQEKSPSMQLITLCIRETAKWVLLLTVKTQMKCRIMQYLECCIHQGLHCCYFWKGKKYLQRKMQFKQNNLTPLDMYTD